MIKKIVWVLLVGLNIANAYAQSLAINTDVAQWALQTYNLGAEMTIGNRSTLLLSGFATNNPYWSNGTKMIGVQPELRYYFSGRPMYHHFVGVGAVAVDYDIKWKDTQLDGFAAGAGLTFGYVATLSKRWTIDAHAGFGLIMFHQKKSKTDLPNLETTNGIVSAHGYTGYQLMPTKIGITLSYIIR